MIFYCLDVALLLIDLIRFPYYRFYLIQISKFKFLFKKFISVVFIFDYDNE